MAEVSSCSGGGERRDGGARRGAMVLEADIDAGDAGDRTEVVAADDLRGQTRLQDHRRLRRQIPGMARANLHRPASAITSGTSISSVLTPPCTPIWRCCFSPATRSSSVQSSRITST